MAVHWRVQIFILNGSTITTVQCAFSKSSEGGVTRVILHYYFYVPFLKKKSFVLSAKVEINIRSHKANTNLPQNFPSRVTA
jgi:hypothetical protein